MTAKGKGAKTTSRAVDVGASAPDPAGDVELPSPEKFIQPLPPAERRRGLRGWFRVLVWGATWIVAALASMLFIEAIDIYLAGGSEYD